MYDLAVVLRAEERVIGSCTLALLDYEPRHATFLYRFNRRSWRRGYATEAMRALFEYGFKTSGLHRIAIADTCDARHAASVRVIAGDGETGHAARGALPRDNLGWRNLARRIRLRDPGA